MLKKIARAILKIGVIFRPVVRLECYLAAKWVSTAHKRLMYLQWRLGDNPEHFDHHIDLYYQWLQTRNSLWLERGVYGSLALQGGRCLELACGDGFNARNFYSLRSERVVACDFDKDAIDTASKKNRAKNIDYILADIRTEMPGRENEFENIIFDAAIEHFTEKEIAKIISDIKLRLTKHGVLSGYTLVEKEDGSKHLHQHEYEFKNKQDLYRVLEPHFKHIGVFETVYPSRHNLYFWASDHIIPFQDRWQHWIHR